MANVFKIVGIVILVVWLLVLTGIALYYLWPCLSGRFTGLNKISPQTEEPQPIPSAPQQKLVIPRTIGLFSGQGPREQPHSTPPILPPKEVPSEPGSLPKTWPLPPNFYKMNVMRYDMAVKSIAVGERSEDDYVAAREGIDNKNKLNEEYCTQQKNQESVEGRRKLKHQWTVAETNPIKHDFTIIDIPDDESPLAKPVIADVRRPTEKQLDEILPDIQGTQEDNKEKGRTRQQDY